MEKKTPKTWQINFFLITIQTRDLFCERVKRVLYNRNKLI